eukprot:2773978-Rhodomonas_salina.1
MSDGEHSTRWEQDTHGSTGEKRNRKGNALGLDVEAELGDLGDGRLARAPHAALLTLGRAFEEDGAERGVGLLALVAAEVDAALVAPDLGDGGEEPREQRLDQDERAGVPDLAADEPQVLEPLERVALEAAEGLHALVPEAVEADVERHQARLLLPQRHQQ